MARFRALPAHERGAAVEAIMLLCAVRAVIAALGVSRTMRLRAHVSRTPAHACTPTRLVALVASVAHLLPWRTTCLHRTVVSAFMLSRRGLPGNVAIGVRSQAGQLLAHAWIADAAPQDEIDAYTLLAHWPGGATFDRR